MSWAWKVRYKLFPSAFTQGHSSDWSCVINQCLCGTCVIPNSLRKQKHHSFLNPAPLSPTWHHLLPQQVQAWSRFSMRNRERASSKRFSSSFLPTSDHLGNLPRVPRKACEGGPGNTVYKHRVALQVFRRRVQIQCVTPKAKMAIGPLLKALKFIF